jgi:hypothetical protein
MTDERLKEFIEAYDDNSRWFKHMEQELKLQYIIIIRLLLTMFLFLIESNKKEG